MVMEREFNMIIEEGEDGYLISEVVELSGCHTQAKTFDQLIKRTKEAIELCLESGQIAEEKFVGFQKVKV
jgi:predicted RNase H-like HicB family nuclease